MAEPTNTPTTDAAPVSGAARPDAFGQLFNPLAEGALMGTLPEAAPVVEPDAGPQEAPHETAAVGEDAHAPAPDLEVAKGEDAHAPTPTEASEETSAEGADDEIFSFEEISTFFPGRVIETKEEFTTLLTEEVRHADAARGVLAAISREPGLHAILTAIDRGDSLLTAVLSSVEGLESVSMKAPDRDDDPEAYDEFVRQEALGAARDEQQAERVRQDGDQEAAAYRRIEENFGTYVKARDLDAPAQQELSSRIAPYLIGDSQTKVRPRDIIQVLDVGTRHPEILAAEVKKAREEGIKLGRGEIVQQSAAEGADLPGLTPSGKAETPALTEEQLAAQKKWGRLSGVQDPMQNILNQRNRARA